MYLDDELTLIATAPHLIHTHAQLHHFIINHLYEHDQQTKRLQIEPQDTNKFLQANIIIHNNNRNIKITYHNKNQDIHLTKHQNVGRLRDSNAPSTHAQKAANISCLLTLVHDFTTLDIDMLKPAAAIIIEAAQLHYQPTIILSALHRANRTRPSHVWHALSHIAKHTN